MRKIFTKFFIFLALPASLLGVSACNKYLDVVPDDGLASIETAFNLRSTAIRYLATCYSYMTLDGMPGSDAAMMTGDELWDLDTRVTTYVYNKNRSGFPIAKGLQSASICYNNDWKSMYEGIRCCDILVDHIDRVPDMTDEEKQQWKAEASFLKAYYHFNLIRKWGPVPIIRKSLPIDSSVEDVRVFRDNIDDCFDYVLDLLEEAMPYLPIINPSLEEFGRINKTACAGLKAKVSVYAASPLFNGNEELASLADSRGVKLFPAKTGAQKQERWKNAMTACEEAIEICEEANLKLYNISEIQNKWRMCDTLARELTIRGAFCERWNSEIVWGNTQPVYSAFQQFCLPILQTDGGKKYGGIGGWNFIGVPMKIAEHYYTKNGLPLKYDLALRSKNQFEIRKGDESHKYYIKQGYESIQLNFDREPRFYAYLGFDGGKWLGQLGDKYNDLKPDDVFTLECRAGQLNGKTGKEMGPVTGYLPKKLAPYQLRWSGNANAASLSTYWYPFPMIRLTDLYLLYAEAINEYEGPDGAHSEELFRYLDAVRERAGIPGVKDAWDKYSTKPAYYKEKFQMREILHDERINEFAFEGQRFWDLRRWKEAAQEYQKGIYGMRVAAGAAKDYNTKTFIATQNFVTKDYFWPIYTYYIDRNPNLVQNIGW